MDVALAGRRLDLFGHPRTISTRPCAEPGRDRQAATITVVGTFFNQFLGRDLFEVVRENQSCKATRGHEMRYSTLKALTVAAALLPAFEARAADAISPVVVETEA